MRIRKALSFRASSIGDCLMGKYLLENIRAAYPDARLGIVIGGRGGMIRDLFAAYPWIEVIEANRRHPASLVHLARRFFGSDLVVTLYTGGTLNLSTKLVARLLARPGGLVGFSDPSPWNRFLFDITLPHYFREGVPRLHEKRTLEAVGVPVATERMTFAYLPQPGLLPRLGLTRGRYVVVGLFSGADARGLAPQKRQELIDALHSALAHTTLVFIGIKAERESLSSLSLPEDSVIADTTVQEVAALIDGSLGMVSLGTGTSHIAAHLATPLIVLVSCQGLQWVGQEQFGDAPMRVFCDASACPAGGHDYSTYAPCINALAMEDVARVAHDLFTSTKRPSG